MRTLLGVLRMAIAGPVIVLATLFILITSPLPLRIRGVRLSAWFTTLAARLAMPVFNVRFRCPNPEMFWQHQGFVFANHISFYDILMLLHVMPMRFLSAQENRKMLFIGTVAQAIDTVFVNRSDKASRAAARQTLLDTRKFPPIVLYPEGGVGPANSLQTFRYGAFETAMEGRTPYLLAAIRYSRADIIVWGEGEGFMDTFWRLACFPGPIIAELVPLRVVHPQPTDDPKRLAADAHREIAAAMGVTPKME
ncbi:MAG: 1-acyl-sn-glycerol-3-phosphate acyltransferase [Anaerolineales bacterium]